METGSHKNRLTIAGCMKILLSKNNPVFIQALQGKRLPNVIITTIGFAAVMSVAFLAYGIFGTVIFGDSELLDTYGDGIVFLIAPFLMIIGLLFFWVTRVEKRSFWTIGFSGSSPFSKFIRGFIIGLMMMSATVAMMAIAGGLEFEMENAADLGTGTIVGVIILLIGFLVQSSTEEIMCRGWYFQVLGARYAPWIGLLISTVLFTLLHFATSILANINLILFSLFLVFLYLYEGSIWGVMGWHSAWNWMQSCVFGMALSGTGEYKSTLLNLRPTGSSILSGGDYGPEGSLFCTVSFIAGILLIFRFTGKKHSQVLRGDIHVEE